MVYKHIKKLCVIIASVLICMPLTSCDYWNEQNNGDTEEITGTIRWATWENYTADYHEDVISSFSEKYPGVVIEIKEYPLDRYFELVTLALNNYEVDVVDIPDSICYRNWVGQGQLKSLNGLISKNKVDTSVIKSVITDLTIDNRLYMLPYELDYYLLFYNKTKFDERNVDYPNEEMTWSIFQRKAKELTTDTEKGTYFSNNWISAVYPAIAESTISINKGPYTSGLYNYYNMLLQMQNKDKSTYPFEEGSSKDDSLVKFVSQEAAMVLMPISSMRTLYQRNLPFKWGITNYPHTNGTTAGNTVCSVYGTAMAAEAGEDLAWLFVQWRWDQEGRDDLIEKNRVPANTDSTVINKLRKVKEFPSDTESYKALLPITYHLISKPHDKMEEIEEEFSITHEQIMTQKLDLATALEQMQKRIDALNNK